MSFVLVNGTMNLFHDAIFIFKKQFLRTSNFVSTFCALIPYKGAVHIYICPYLVVSKVSCSFCDASVQQVKADMFSNLYESVCILVDALGKPNTLT